MFSTKKITCLDSFLNIIIQPNHLLHNKKAGNLLAGKQHAAMLV
jgi:hypothetical protein